MKIVIGILILSTIQIIDCGFNVDSSSLFPHDIKSPFSFILTFSKNITSTDYFVVKIRDRDEKEVFTKDVFGSDYSKLNLNNNYVQSIQVIKGRTNMEITLQLYFKRMASKHALELLDKDMKRFFRSVVDLLISPQVIIDAQLLNNTLDKLQVKCISKDAIPVAYPKFLNLDQFRVISQHFNSTTNTQIVVLLLKQSDQKMLYCSAGNVRQKILIQGQGAKLKIQSRYGYLIYPDERLKCSTLLSGTKASGLEWKVLEGPDDKERYFKINNGEGVIKFKDAPLGSLWVLSCSIKTDWYGIKKTLSRKMKVIVVDGIKLSNKEMIQKSIVENSYILNSEIKGLKENEKELKKEINKLSTQNNFLKASLDNITKLMDSFELFSRLINPIQYYVWKVENLVQKRKIAVQGGQQIYYSPSFYSSGYKFHLRIDPGGFQKIHQFVSVFFEILRGDWDDKLEWPFSRKIKISLLNQDRKSIKDISFQHTGKKEMLPVYARPIRKSNIGIGDIKFISWSEIENSNILHSDNSIYLKCEIS